MSVMEAEIQWFIARDGKQHGPVSDLEMRKLVELGHLRATDLLWRLGFPDWRPAPAVFTPPPSAVRQPQPAPKPAPSQPQPSQPSSAAPAPQQTIAPRYEPANAGHVAAPPGPQPLPTASAPQFDIAGPAPAAGFGLAPMAGPGPMSAPGQAPGPMSGPGAGFGSAPMPSQLSALRSDTPSGGRRPGGPFPTNEPRPQLAAPGPGRAAKPAFDDEDEPRRGWLKPIVIAAALVAVVGGGGWLAYSNLATLKAMASRSAPGASKLATNSQSANSKPAGTPLAEAKATPVAAVAISAEELDAKLQKAQHWAIVRQQFAEWYQARIKEAARLSSTDKTPLEVSGYLTQGLVELRRSHADKALAASRETLQTMASAFLANVGKLSQESTEACMAFILKGEASPPVLEIIENPSKNAEINAHFVAIFTAVAEGMKSPAQHSDPNEADYQLLVAQLTKLGWAPQDLQLFADPRGPAKTSPDRYCKMMHEFFAAHLAVEDAGARDRLLYRTLKLVVAG